MKTVNESDTIYHSRTHFKVLFVPIFYLLIGITLHVITQINFPEYTGIEFIDDWGLIITHVIILLLELWFVVFPILRWSSETYTLTPRSVRNDWGILNRNSREIDLTRIASISEERDLIDRFFSCGTLNFYDAAAGAQPETRGAWNSPQERNKAGVRFHDVPNIKHVRSLIEEARDNLKN